MAHGEEEAPEVFYAHGVGGFLLVLFVLLRRALPFAAMVS